MLRSPAGLTARRRPYIAQSFRCAVWPIALWAAACAGLIAVGRLLADPLAPAIVDAPAAEAAIERALDTKVTPAYNEMPLADVVEDLRKAHGIEVQIDHRALQDASIAADTPITIHADPMTLRSALHHMLGPTELRAIVADEVLLITTPDKESGNLQTRLQNVEDLLLLGDGDQPDADSLIDVITSSVQPSSWTDGGGMGSIEVMHNVLILSQTSAVHREVGALLAAMRRAIKRQAEGAIAEAVPVLCEPDAAVANDVATKLRQKVTLNFNQIPLVDVVEQLRKAHGLPLLLDAKALEDASISRDTQVTADLRGVSLGAALQRILGGLSLVHAVDSEALLITTPDRANALLTCRVYPVVDLVDETHAEVDRKAAPVAVSGVSVVDRRNATAIADNVDADSLIDVITSIVAPTTWNDGGGPGSIAWFEPGQVLVCTTTDDIHEQVGHLLSSLRRERLNKPEPLKKAARAAEQPVNRIYVLNTDDKGKPVVPADELAKEVTQLVEPGKWEAGKTYSRVVVGRLLVRNTPAVQKKVEKLLEELQVWTKPSEPANSGLRGGKTPPPSGALGGFF